MISDGEQSDTDERGGLERKFYRSARPKNPDDELVDENEQPIGVNIDMNEAENSNEGEDEGEGFNEGEGSNEGEGEGEGSNEGENSNGLMSIWILMKVMRILVVDLIWDRVDQVRWVKTLTRLMALEVHDQMEKPD